MQKKGEKMLSLSNKKPLFGALAFLSLNFFSSSLVAFDSCDSCSNNRFYIGGFGGGLYSDSTRISQMGTAFFTEAEGGPLAIYAKGKTKSTSTGFGGVQIGYEWRDSALSIGCSDWSLSAAAEIEGFWYSHKKKGHLINPTDRLPEHDFLDTFHINSGVYLANAVLSLNNSCFSSLTPYIGVGVGATRLSFRDADSLQTSPVENGVNHFNSRRNDDSWAFAAQAKAGIRYNFCESFHIFGEYRYLYIDSSNYIFGSTVYPTHAPTSPWNVKVHNIQYNAFVLGIQYDL